MAAVLARAFADDPVVSYLFPSDARRREQRLSRFFDLELPRSEALGGSWMSADGAGAAIWFPPGTWRPSTWATLRQTPAALRVFGRNIGRASRAQSVMQEHHPARPHWYLYYLGTEPEKQGIGIGAAVLRPVLDLCDSHRLPAYLEASSPRNSALYRRHGFEELDPLVLPEKGPTMYPMWREPQ
ncbi:Acetyltransferase (GNAT) domain-containing protein [Geodermatophilus africanus]|uniref:Acetyltransferase (GNAT) domain-containing protein n=2 Tax=Geodermatophilus africanus TaxID=1137993 RepID=A0A1H3DN05_9ACTN|nr:Acetyltransferase (GNAT) domain-containing protein [Geodermatophilus africanus]